MDEQPEAAHAASEHGHEDDAPVADGSMEMLAYLLGPMVAVLLIALLVALA